MKKISILLLVVFSTLACTNAKHAEYEENTETAKTFFKLHETEQAEEMFTYLHKDMEWHMPVYGMGIGGIDEVKAAIIGYQAEFDNMKFTADYWLPGVDSETGEPDGSTRVYGTWNSIHSSTGKETTLTSYHSFEFKDGKIINGGDWFDLGGMMNSVSPNFLQKGNLMSLHVMDIKLNKGATAKQYQDYWMNEVIPHYEKAIKGSKIYLADGLRGEESGKLSMIWIFENEEARDIMFDADRDNKEFRDAIWKKLQPYNDELAKLGSWTSTFTDWSVQ